MMSETLLPGEVALGLPPRAYTDPQWLAREQERVFERAWTLVASAEELAGPDSAVSATIGRIPIVIERAADGALRAFADRGDGAGLAPASTAIWEGMVFAHVGATPTTFEDALDELPDHIGSFRPGLLTEVARCRLEGQFNWKLFVENHIDVYHLWYLHEGSLGAFDHTKFQHWRLGVNWASYEPLRASATRMTPADQATAPIRHIDDRDRNGIGAHMVFPNVLMASTAEFFATYAVYPLSPSRSRIDLRIRAEADADADLLMNATRSFINEDIEACEGVQEALGSARFHVGAFAADHEKSIAEFQHDLLAAMGEPQ
jgi:Rieske 2Fe-2S family protein